MIQFSYGIGYFCYIYGFPTTKKSRVKKLLSPKDQIWYFGQIPIGFEDYGFNRIVAKVMTDNIGSIKVLQKLGFVQEGVLRESLYKNGQYHDLICFSILKSEYHRTN